MFTDKNLACWLNIIPSRILLKKNFTRRFNQSETLLGNFESASYANSSE